MNNRAAQLTVGTKSYTYFPVSQVEGYAALPYSLTVLLENILRNARSDEEAKILSERLVEAGTKGVTGEEIEFSPARVLFQDFTGVPVFVDFAVMREACAELGGDPKNINPQIPCDLVIDHSVIADESGCAAALANNMELEFERNKERYDFLKWSQESFQNVRIVPPGSGICHQLNIERFERYEVIRENEQRSEAFMLDDAEIVVVAFGASSRVARSAVVAAREEGIKVGLRPITLWPFPTKAIEETLSHAKAFLSVEMNMGQMVDDVRLAVNGRAAVDFYGRTGGVIPTPEEVLSAIKDSAKRGGVL